MRPFDDDCGCSTGIAENGTIAEHLISSSVRYLFGRSIIVAWANHRMLLVCDFSDPRLTKVSRFILASENGQERLRGLEDRSPTLKWFHRLAISDDAASLKVL